MVSTISVLLLIASLVSILAISLKKWMPKYKKQLLVGSVVIALITGLPFTGWTPDVVGNLVEGRQAFSVSGVAPSSPDVSGQLATTTEVTNKCPANRQTTMRVSLSDELASSVTYIGSSTVYFFDGVDNPERLSATTGSSGFDISQSVTCPQEYKLVAVTQAGVAGSTEYVRKTSLSNEFVELKTVQISPLQFRIKDITTDTYQTWFNDGSVTGGNNTNYTVMNDTRIYSSSAGESANLTVGADGFIDTEILVKTVDNRQTAGEHLPFYVCVDLNRGSSSGSTNWDVPIVSFEGRRLTDVKSTLDPDSLSGSLISQAEYCFKLTDDGATLGDTEKKVLMRFNAKSGANPTTSDDIEVQWLPVGRYYSNKVTNTIKQGIYDDQATGVLVVPASNRRPAFTINVQ